MSFSRELIEVDQAVWDKLDHTMVGQPVYCRTREDGIDVWPQWDKVYFDSGNYLRPRIWVGW